MHLHPLRCVSPFVSLVAATRVSLLPCPPRSSLWHGLLWSPPAPRPILSGLEPLAGQLKLLNLASNRLTSLDGLRALVRVEIVNLQENQIADLTQLGSAQPTPPSPSHPNQGRTVSTNHKQGPKRGRTAVRSADATQNSQNRKAPGNPRHPIREGREERRDGTGGGGGEGTACAMPTPSIAHQPYTGLAKYCVSPKSRPIACVLGCCRFR